MLNLFNNLLLADPTAIKIPPLFLFGLNFQKSTFFIFTPDFIFENK